MRVVDLEQLSRAVKVTQVYCALIRPTFLWRLARISPADEASKCKEV